MEMPKPAHVTVVNLQRSNMHWLPYREKDQHSALKRDALVTRKSAYLAVANDTYRYDE